MSSVLTKIAVVYIRVSSDEQVDGTSLNFQEEQCRQYCTRKGFTDIVVFREEGASAKDLSLNNRKEFLRGIEFCRKNKGKVQIFVVLRVNRFARNTEDHFLIRKKLLDYGVTLHSVTEPIGNKPSEKLTETVLAASADYENAIRTQQCTDGMSEKINEGLYPWPVPLGYISAGSKKHGLKKTEPDIPDDARFFLIRRLFINACLEDKIKGSVDLARLANTWGLTTRAERKIYPQLIDKIFANRFYAGIIHNPFTHQDVVGKHHAIVSLEEFNQIQLIRKGKVQVSTIKRLKNNPDFPLTKDVKCYACNSGLGGSHPRGNGGVYSYYHCHNKRCAMYGKNIQQAKLHEDFIKLLVQVTPKKEFLDLFSEIVIDVWKGKGAVLEEALKRQEHEIGQLKVKKLDYVEMIRKGVVAEDFGKELIAGVDDEIAIKQISAHENNIDKLDVETAVAYATTFIADLPRQWTDLEVEHKKRFQKLVFPQGITYDKNLGFGTPELSLIYQQKKNPSLDSSSLVARRGIEPLFSP